MKAARSFAHNHRLLALAILGGILTALLLPASWKVETRVLSGWNVMVWSYLCLMAWLMMRANYAQVRKLAEQEDESAAMVLVIMSLASVASLGAIVVELPAIKELTPGMRLSHYLFTGATVLGSWLLLGIVFTHHYARQFYRSPANKRVLHFPDNEQNPDYWDFLYFSFTIGVAVQTSDVSVLSKSLRKSVLAQSMLSFLFNVAIVGLSINIAAGLLGS